ncbi:MAG: extracellular solute-binding protein, partial [Pseudomonadota bacterium]|nr:extracellular solute-binding protein [Pseudomonadota bacterium]
FLLIMDICNKFLNKFLIMLTILLVNSSILYANSSIAIGYTPKYSNNFKNFEYVNPDIMKGGSIKLSAFGSFESLNPFLLKSLSAAGLNDLVFETLMERSLDEPSSSYAHIASSYEIADDKLSVIYYIDDKAKFSNGERIRAVDVKFSFDTLMSNDAHPQYRLYWADVNSAEVLNEYSVRFVFKKTNPELHMMLGDLPIFSAEWFNKKQFNSVVLDDPIASGPYIVSDYEIGRFIEYKRNPKYWANKKPTRVGMFNFDTIIFKYYKDMTVALEAFKAGEYDFIYENHSKRWARDYSGPNFDNGVIIKRQLKHSNNTGIQGFVFNTRKEIFQNREIRKAITLAFDFKWSNDNLFYNQYERCDSYFSNSELSASIVPSDNEVMLAKKLGINLNRLKNKEHNFIVNNNIRDNLIEAKKIFDKLGFKVVNNKLFSPQGKKVEFSFLLAQKGFERILAPFAMNLKKLGITLNYRTIDTSLYQRRVDSFDFDMMVMSYPQSQSPGSELYAMFHSSSSERRGSFNVGGINDKDVDKLIDEIIYSKKRDDLIIASHLLDRILWNDFYMLPNWYISEHRIAYFDKFNYPEKLPKYFQATNYILKTWAIKYE